MFTQMKTVQGKEGFETMASDGIQSALSWHRLLQIHATLYWPLHSGCAHHMKKGTQAGGINLNTIGAHLAFRKAVNYSHADTHTT